MKQPQPSLSKSRFVAGLQCRNAFTSRFTAGIL